MRGAASATLLADDPAAAAEVTALAAARGWRLERDEDRFLVSVDR